MDENTQAKFAEKVKELLNMAKKKKNVLEYQEISDFFGDMPLEEEQMEKVLEYFSGRKSPNMLVIPLCKSCHTGSKGIHGDRAMWRIYKANELVCLAETLKKVFYG